MRAGESEPSMFHQVLTPVAGSLLLSALVAAVPVFVVLIMLGVLRRPAWQASAAGLAAALLLAVLVWQFPVGMALNAAAAGAVFALWPVMWIVFFSAAALQHRRRERALLGIPGLGVRTSAG